MPILSLMPLATSDNQESSPTTTTASRDLADINEIQEQRLKEQGSGKAQVGFARDVKNSLLFKYDWTELLSAAPLALSIMGSCYIAATSPLANLVSLEEVMPKGGFKYIKRPELKSCLVQVSDAGRMAFLTAEKNMSLIDGACVSLGRYMGSILQHLPYMPDPDASGRVNDGLELLKAGSDSCLEYAQAVEDEFNHWLLLVCELHLMTSAKEGKVGIEERRTNSKISGVQAEVKLSAKYLSNAQDVAKTLKTDLDDAKKLYKKAVDAVPGPWESIALNFVGGLTSQISTLFAQGVPSMMSGTKSNMSPSSGSDVQSAAPTSHAYPDSVATSPIITSLLTLLTAEKIQWGSLDDILTPLKSTLDFELLHYKWTNEQPSQDLKGAINKCLTVIAAILKANEGSGGIASTEPDEETVKKWRENVTSAKSTVTTLCTVAAGIPGNAPTAPPQLKAPVASSAPAGNAAQSALNSATEKVNITQAAYVATQENYVRASKAAMEAEMELGRIKANLKSLEADKVTLAGIKTILVQCIGALVQMKTHVTNLVRFFNALSAMVEHVVQRNVQDFVKQIGSAQRVLTGGLSMLDISRQELYTISLMCQAYFSLFSTIARMYTTVSVKHIKRGVELCDELSKSTGNPEVVAQRVRELDNFTDESQKAVREIVAKEQQEILKTLQDRVTKSSQDIDMLPPRLKLPAAVSQAINHGKEELSALITHNDERILPDAGMSPDEI